MAAVAAAKPSAATLPAAEGVKVKFSGKQIQSDSTTYSKGLIIGFFRIPLVAWQLQYSLTAFGTLINHIHTLWFIYNGHREISLVLAGR